MPLAKKKNVKKVPASVQLLLLQLKNADAPTRKNGQETIPTLHAPPEPLTDTIGDLFEHENWYVRESAADALSRTIEVKGAPDLAVKKVAGPLLDHKDEETRRCAGRSLAAMVSLIDSGEVSDETTAKAAAAEVAARLTSEEPLIRRNAVDALMQMGPFATPHMSQVAAVSLADPDVAVRSAAVRSFTILGTHAASGAMEAGAQLASDDPVVRRTGARAIVALAASSGVAAAEGVAAHLFDKKPITRTAAALCLAELGPLAAPHGKDLAKLLEDPEVQVRRAAVRALTQAGPKVVTSLNVIKARLSSESSSTRRAAVDTMRSLAATCPVFAQTMGKVLHEETQQQTADTIRQMAQILEILGGAGKNAVPYLEDICRELEASDWAIRTAAIEALADLEEHAEKGAREVARRMLHPDRDIRRAAAEALGRMGKHAGEYGRRVENLLDTEEDEDVIRTCERAQQRLLQAGAIHSEDGALPAEQRTSSPRQSSSPQRSSSASPRSPKGRRKSMAEDGSPRSPKDRRKSMTDTASPRAPQLQRRKSFDAGK